jgi:hypothetical protein
MMTTSFESPATIAYLKLLHPVKLASRAARGFIALGVLVLQCAYLAMHYLTAAAHLYVQWRNKWKRASAIVRRPSGANDPLKYDTGEVEPGSKPHIHHNQDPPSGCPIDQSYKTSEKEELKPPEQLPIDRRMAGNGLSLKFWKKKQYVCLVRNSHSSRPVLVVAKMGDVKETARGAGSVSFSVNANPTGGGGAVSRSTDNTYEWRPSMLWMKTIQVQQEARLRVRGSSCVHVTVLFPQDIERRRYYLAEGTYLNVKTCNLVVDENDFHESIPVVEIDLTPTALNLSIPPREPPPAVSSWTRPFSRFR